MTPQPDFESSAAPVRVALVGTRGYGRRHLENLDRLSAAGIVELMGVVDIAEPSEALRPLWHGSLTELVEGHDPDLPEVVIIATPIDTHVPLAQEALAAGCHVYLEKPPVPALEDHWALVREAERVGRAVQVGFQSRGGAGIDALRDQVTAGAGIDALRDQVTAGAGVDALRDQVTAGAGVDALRDQVTAGALGEITAVRVHGAWVRDRAYYRRSPWAGRRRLGGRRVADGVATNPLAHGIHAGLVIAGIHRIEDIALVTTELRRAHDIEADDTAFVRIDPVGDRPPVVAALTTTAPQHRAPWVEIVGPHGSQRLSYTEDRSWLTTLDGAVTERDHPRVDLVENLLAHVRDPQVELLSPLESSGAFTAVLEAIQSAPDPTVIDAEHVTWIGEGEAAHPVVEDIDTALLTALNRASPFSRNGVVWARENAISAWRPADHPSGPR